LRRWRARTFCGSAKKYLDPAKFIVLGWGIRRKFGEPLDKVGSPVMRGSQYSDPESMRRAGNKMTRRTFAASLVGAAHSASREPVTKAQQRGRI